MFINFYNPFVFIYVVGFAALALATRWRSLLLISIAASLFVVGSVLGMSTSNAMGGALAIPLLFFLATGLLAGFLYRALILVGRSRKWKLARPAFIFPLAFFGIPALAESLIYYNHQIVIAQKAPPSQSCLERLHPAIIADTKLELPLAPIFTVGLGQRYYPTYQFQINEHARNFCKVAAASPPKVTNFRISIRPGGSEATAIEKSDFCRNRQPYDWWPAVCRRETGTSVVEYPAVLTVFDVAAYVGGSALHSSKNAWQRYEEELATLTPSTHDGDLAEYVLGNYRIFKRLDQDGFLARCHETSASMQNGQLDCEARTLFAGRIGLVYHFRTTTAEFIVRSQQIENAALDVFSSLLKK